MELPAQHELDPWPVMRTELRRVLGQTAYDIWLAPLKPAAWDGTTLSLAGPAETCAWVLRRYGRLLESCASTLLGRDVRVRLDPAAPDTERGGTKAAPGIRRPRHGDPPISRGQETGPRIPPRSLNPRYSFEQFIIGEGNRLAHAAALAVAELPGQAYNPLFLHAPPGLGKTHLLHAIGNYVAAFGGGAAVLYTTAEDFTNHFVRALGSRGIDEFKRRYRDVDVLLIDDVQFLASKAKTEEEFFHTFNALYENGRQLVLTCDRIPAQLAGIAQRLRDRFEAGLVAEIAPPDLASRVAILRKRAALDHISLQDPRVLELIAERIEDNIRALEGALIRVVAYHSLTGRPIDQGLVEMVLASIEPAASRAAPLSIETIQQAVAAHFSISVPEMVSAARTARVVWPRQVAIYLARELTDASLPAIGQAFGGRNHATIIHACRRVAQRTREAQQHADEVGELRDRLARPQPDRAP